MDIIRCNHLIRVELRLWRFKSGAKKGGRRAPKKKNRASTETNDRSVWKAFFFWFVNLIFPARYVTMFGGRRVATVDWDSTGLARSTDSLSLFLLLLLLLLPTHHSYPYLSYQFRSRVLYSIQYPYPRQAAVSLCKTLRRRYHHPPTLIFVVFWGSFFVRFSPPSITPRTRGGAPLSGNEDNNCFCLYLGSVYMFSSCFGIYIYAYMRWRGLKEN